jgi:hypothetical protein
VCSLVICASSASLSCRSMLSTNAGNSTVMLWAQDRSMRSMLRCWRDKAAGRRTRRLKAEAALSVLCANAARRAFLLWRGTAKADRHVELPLHARLVCKPACMPVRPSVVRSFVCLSISLSVHLFS